MAEVFVTNFNRNFTGVSATAANVFRAQSRRGSAVLVGEALPDCPAPISTRQARAQSRAAPAGKPFAIWHVRRNPEMRAAIWARDVLKLPIRIVFTSAAQRLHSWYPRQLINRMDAVIATTPKAAEFVPHVRAVVPHGVDTALFHPAADRAQAWAASGFGGQQGIATVGRIRAEKGTDRFVAAMIQTLPHLSGTVALVVGRAGRSDQKFLADLKTQVAQAGLSDRILFPGEIPAAQMPAFMRSISLLVALPRYEGYGMTPLEAMASGTPFVATDTGYFQTFSDQGQAGVVVSATQAANAVQALLQNPGKLSTMSLHAASSVQNTHSIAREVAGIEAVYGQLWDGGPHDDD